jgi:hypothetical protein
MIFSPRASCPQLFFSEVRATRPLEKIAEGLTREQARGVEQALLNEARRAGVKLENKINSIARSNRIYDRAVAYGNKLLSDIGFKF